MAPPSSSLLRDLLAADGFKNRRRSKPPRDNNLSAPAASRAASMPLQDRRPGKPARSQSDVLTTRSRLRNGGTGSDDGSRDAAGEERRAAVTRRRSLVASVRSYSNKGDSSDSGTGGRPKAKGPAAADAVPPMDESALNALISLAAGPMKRFALDEGFRASLRAGCASCLGASDHRAALDLRVLAQTVERAAREGDTDRLDPRDLKRASAKLHEAASLGAEAAAAVTAASGVPYRRLAACAHVYMSAVSKLQNRDHSAAVHALEAFCLAPREARTALLPQLWDRLFRPGLAHLRTWRECEAAAAASGGSDDGRVKEVEKAFGDAVDEGTRVLACYYRDWLLGRTNAMALPDVAAPPSTVTDASGGFRCSTSTSYDIGSDVFFSSGSLSSPGKVTYDSATVRRSYENEIEEEEEVLVGTALEEELRLKVHVNGVFHDHEGDDGDARSGARTPMLQAEEENVLAPNKFVLETPESKDEPTKEPVASTSYPLTSDTSAVEHLTLEFCEVPLQSNAADGNRVSVSTTVPSDFLCPLTRQIFNRPVTIETGQTFERHAIVQWFDRGFRVCPVTGQELESLSIPDTNRVIKRLIDNWKTEHSEISGIEEKLLIEKFIDSASDVSGKLDRARRLMAIGGLDFLLRKFQQGGEDEKVRAAEHLLLCVQAEGSCRNYVAIKIHGSSVLQLLRSEVLSARRAAVCLLTELLCLRRRGMFELLFRGCGRESIIEAMDVLLEYLRTSLAVEEQAPAAVLLLQLDALVENHGSNAYKEEAAKIIAHSLRCCLSDDTVAPNTRKALLLLGGQFSFSGEPLTEDWMLNHAGFVDDSRTTPTDPDAVVQDSGTAEYEAWLRQVTVSLLGSAGRRPLLEALPKCLGSPDAGLVGACLTTAGWLTRSLASADDATDMQLAAFSALVPRLKQCLAPARPARHRVLAVVSLHNFSRIPDCRALLTLLVDGLRDDLADLEELTWTARQLSAQLQE